MTNLIDFEVVFANCNIKFIKLMLHVQVINLKIAIFCLKKKTIEILLY